MIPAEMARNAIESGFRSSKMASSSHFVKIKLCIDQKLRKMRSILGIISGCSLTRPSTTSG